MAARFFLAFVSLIPLFMHSQVGDRMAQMAQMARMVRMAAAFMVMLKESTNELGGFINQARTRRC